MSDWNANQYLKFEDERTRPPRDLIAQVPLARAERVFDLGCGPGNSTELLIARYPQAEVIGLDSSSDMLRQARERLPDCAFVQADLATWTPPRAPICCSPMRRSSGCRITGGLRAHAAALAAGRRAGGADAGQYATSRRSRS